MIAKRTRKTGTGAVIGPEVNINFTLNIGSELLPFLKENHQNIYQSKEVFSINYSVIGNKYDWAGETRFIGQIWVGWLEIAAINRISCSPRTSHDLAYP
ncbi:hypothetical protein [Microcoleus vaginatus]|uniref:hypothetical protein n=1 Tax=Microcoleus vaginatus TaxID=119532 RepID=UPI001F60A1F7